MINADDEISLAYLLEPTFQIENTEGRPLTGGWIEVYLHGTRTKYYCYSDWNGSLHPFKIPLDSLGANIVLASPAHSYDIYIYNKYGTLVMSRYNIVPSTGDGTVIKDVVEITSEDGTIKVTETTDVVTNTKKFDLSVNGQGGGTTYTAGDAIDLTNDTISVKYGKGLEITTDNKLQLKVGKGLTFDNDSLELISGEGIYYTPDGKLTTVEPESNFIDITDEWQFVNGFRLQYHNEFPGYGNDMRIYYSPVSDTVKFTSSCRINRTSVLANSWNVMLQYKGDRFYTTHNAPNVELMPSIGLIKAIGGIQYVTGTDNTGTTSSALLRFSYVGSPNDPEELCGLGISYFLNNNNNPAIYGCILQNLILKVHKKI